jgi:hypothetical protein
MNDMTSGTATLITVVGLGMIVAGLTGKQFYAGHRTRSEHPIPRWQGATLFLAIGGLLVVLGVTHLVVAFSGR